jgi:hypothetical protein
MNARKELFAAYAEWRRWSELESTAIEAANWPRVHDCQRAKQSLQARIIRATDQARQECTRFGLQHAELENEVRTVVAELIQWEARNSESLAEQRQTARGERAALGRASLNLRRLHRSYGGGRAAGWTSFS